MFKGLSSPSFSPFKRSSSNNLKLEISEALNSPITSPSSTPPLFDTLALAKQDLLTSLESLQSISRRAYSHKFALLSQIQHILEEQEETRDTFVDQGGFLLILSVLSSLEEGLQDENTLVEGEDSLEVRSELRNELVKLIFLILEVVLRENEIHRIAFEEKIGYKALSEAIQLSGLMRSNDSEMKLVSTPSSKASSAEKVLSILYSFLVGDFSSPPLYTSLRLQLASLDSLPSQTPEDADSASEDADSASSSTSTSNQMIAPALATSHRITIARLLDRNISTIKNVAIVVAMLDLLRELEDNQVELQLMVISSILSLSLTSRISQVALCDIGIIKIAIDKLYRDKNVAEGEEREVWKSLLSRSMELGAGSIDLKALLQFAVKGKGRESNDVEAIDEEILDLLLISSKTSMKSSFFNFDFSTHGHSSLSLPSLNKIFPPTTLGYTFLAWISVIEPPSVFDGKLIIFTGRDVSCKSFVEISLDSNLRLGITTSIDKPPVIFESTRLSLNRFYHLAIVHQRSSFYPVSSVLLYLNGTLVETVKQVYPATPPKDWEVTAVLGTPVDRVENSRIGPGKSRMRWECGPTWLMHGDLTEDIIRLCWSLGPRYTSNFQDSLGQFLNQTNSTLDKIRLEALSLQQSNGRQLRNVPVSILLVPGSVIPENRIYFTFSPKNVVEPLKINSLGIVSKSKTVFNSAASNLENIDLSIGSLNGEPSVARLNNVDVEVWKINGMVVLLKLVELATTPQQLTKAIQIFTSVITDSFRNAEEATRKYELVGHLLRQKVDLLSTECCESIFTLIGFDFDQPSKSIIANVEACRLLLLDFSIWSLAAESIQRAHLDRLRAFIEISEFGQYNGKRLAKLHLTRKLLFAIRTESFAAGTTVVSQAISLLMYMSSQYFTTESIRHLSTFISATTTSNQPTVSASSASRFILDASLDECNRDQVGLKVLLGLHNHLLDPINLKDLIKFSKTITTKWLLSLILDGSPFVAIISLRILVRILQQGAANVQKFVKEGEGYPALLLQVVPKLWNHPQFTIALLALLYSHDISLLSLDTPFNNSTFLEETLTNSELAPAILRVLVDSITEGVKIENKDRSESSLTNLVGYISFVEGFDILVELISRVIRTAGFGVSIASNSLHNLVNILAPLLQPLDTANIASHSTLPTISSSNGYDLSPSLPVLESNHINVEPSVLAEGADRIAPTIVINFLGRIAVHRLTYHHRLRNPEDEESCLSVLEQLFDSSAFLNLGDQINFRTRLLQQCFRHVTNLSWTPTSSTRIALLVALAVDLSLEGWNNDVNGILEFTLGYTGKIIQDSPLPSNGFDVQTVDSLFRSINRLTLFALSKPDCLSILLQHQLVIFASPNTNTDLFHCLIYRLYSLLSHQNLSAQSITLIVDFFKLVILQRPVEIEAALKPSRIHNSQSRLSDRLIDTATPDFILVLSEFKEQLDSLESVWEDTSDYETRRAKKSVNSETIRLEEVSRKFFKTSTSQAQKAIISRELISEWKEGIHDVESTRLNNTRQDASDQQVSVEHALLEQAAAVYLSGALLSRQHNNIVWQIDTCEGPHRVRKKVHPQVKFPSHSLSTNFQAVQQNSLALPKPSTSDINSISNAGVDPIPSIDFGEVDQNRRIRRILEPRDVIQHVFNSNRIIGLDSCQSLMILTGKNLYLVDNYFQRMNGDLVTIFEAPDSEKDQHLLTLSELSGHTKPTQVDEETHQSRRWSFSDLVEVYQRKYLYQSTALELFFADGSSHLLVFASKADRSAVYDLFSHYTPQAVYLGASNLAAASLGGKFKDSFLGQRTRLDIKTKEWEAREISNFEYIMFLNTQAGRTYNDLTNYPVFPWILADYASETLDLDNPATFRDLELPMGAQSEERRKESRERYDQLAELGDGTIPFHYGTHYSSASTVAGYLIRCQPFTQAYLDIQQSFDHPDRMFWSIGRAFQSSRSSRTDVRELIPEFFYLPEFLSNHNNLQFGNRQENNSPIDQVELPKWAKSPSDFILQHRNALECDFVSSRLHLWIDLIFGFKSSGPEAIQSLNMFHSLAYENATDLDTLSVQDRKSAIATIHNFGLCPSTLFKKPHPAQDHNSRSKKAIPSRILPSTIAIEKKIQTVLQSSSPVSQIDGPVRQIFPSKTSNKLLATSAILSPGDTDYSINYDSICDKSLRIYCRGILISTLENLHEGLIVCAVFVDSQRLITGSDDTTLSIWDWVSAGKEISLQPIASLRGHTNPITSLASSKAFSVVVSSSGSEAFIWDLNRHQLVHQLEGHQAQISMIAISNSTGDIATISGSVLRIYSINGVFLGSRITTNYIDIDPITSVAFSSSVLSSLIATGHTNGSVSIWKLEAESDGPPDWRIELIRKLQQDDDSGNSNNVSQSAISCLTFTSHSLYTGNRAGSVNMFS